MSLIIFNSRKFLDCIYFFFLFYCVFRTSRRKQMALMIKNEAILPFNRDRNISFIRFPNMQYGLCRTLEYNTSTRSRISYIVVRALQFFIGIAGKRGVRDFHAPLTGSAQSDLQNVDMNNAPASRPPTLVIAFTPNAYVKRIRFTH